MEIVLGPILRLRAVEPDPACWRVSVLVVATGAAAPVLTAAGAAASIAAPELLAEQAGKRVWTIELNLRREAAAAEVVYSLGGAASWRFTVPATSERPRMAYGSCNGFSTMKLAKAQKEPFALWRELGEAHAQAPYHLLMLGGDQVYADSMWERIDELVEWSHRGSFLADLTPMSAGLADALERFYFELYCERWAQPPLAAVLATIPTMMMWDDHDIFDGWGSHPPARQRSPVFQGIFAAARRWFCVFQLQRRFAAPTGEFLAAGPNLGYAHRIDDLAIVALDLRSERSTTQVMSPAAWDAAFKWIDGQQGLAHLIVMTSIPVVFVDLAAVEDALGFVPGQQELEDDLRDHWCSRGHQGERLRLIHRLLDFGAARGTRVTIVSGDVHVAAIGVIESSRDDQLQVISQLISSGIVHPPAPAIVVYALGKLFAAGGAIDRGIELSMQAFPGGKRKLMAARNWLSLEPDAAWATSRKRLWANWHVEREAEPYTKVIHPR